MCEAATILDRIGLLEDRVLGAIKALGTQGGERPMAGEVASNVAAAAMDPPMSAQAYLGMAQRHPSLRTAAGRWDGKQWWWRVDAARDWIRDSGIKRRKRGR